MNGEEEFHNPHPRKKSNFFSVLFFTYTLDTFKKGRAHLWNDSNLYNPLDAHCSNVLGKKVERLWFEYVDQCRIKERKPDIFNVLLKMFWPDILQDSCLLIFSLVPRMVQPFLLKHFLDYFSTESKMTKYETSWYLIPLIISLAMNIIFSVHFKFSCSITAIKMRTCCATLLFKKVLKLSTSASEEECKGNVLNIISNDLSRFDYTLSYVYYLYGSPLFVVSILYLVFYDAGIAGLVGVLWYIAYMFLQSYSARLTGSYRNKVAEKTDKRIKLMNEILSGIRFIKIYAWEQPFCNLISKAREHEIKVLRKVIYLKGIFHSLLSFTNIMAVFVGMITMVLLKEEITAAKVFNLVLYYNSFNFVITLMFPLSIIRATELLQVLKRVNNFMTSEEMVKSDGYCKKHIENVEDLDEKISLRNINAKWKTNKTTKCGDNLKEDGYTDEISLLKKFEKVTVLKDINISLKDCSFLGVTGKVGSGKSSFLSTLLGETFMTGYLSVKGSISYVPQDPWIFAGTIKQNILFGQPLEEERYREVIRVCCLTEDLDQLPEHDMTVVGERGITISGGQKARISLARAVYRDADIYLMDDPLSSIDIHVAHYLLKECINGFLKEKCRILATHLIQHLENCDQIIILNSGRIEKTCSYKELLEQSNNFEEATFQSDVSKECIENVEQEITVSKKQKYPRKQQNSVKTDKITNQKSHKILLVEYLRKGNNMFIILSILFIFIFTQFVESVLYILMSKWAHFEEYKNGTQGFSISSESYRASTNVFIYIFAILFIILIMGSLSKAVFYANMVLNSSKKLHEDILHKVVGSHMSFFDQVDSGQILTRFSKDLGAVDEILPRTFMESFVVLLGLFARIIIIIYLNNYMVLVILTTFFLLIYFVNIFVSTSKNIKRIEGNLMCPILTHVNATIQGLATIRASDAQDIIQKEFDRIQDQYSSSCYMFYTVTHAFSLFVECASFIFISFVTISCFLMNDEMKLSGSEVGLAITQAMAFSIYLQFGIIQSVQVNNNLVAVERIVQYDDLIQEPKIVPAVTIPRGWPQRGEILFENVILQYHEDSAPILNDLSFSVGGGEKIGIVGRTGAGKTSIVSTIMRLGIVTGTIRIDSYDTQYIPLDILRSRIGVISQDPVLFSGTLRYNLDPLQEFDDNVLYKALEKVELGKTSKEFKNLDYHILEEGSNLSLGQKQLICLARTIIREHRIILLDECSSNVDADTDNLIQNIIRKDFDQCTVLTITHRLNTIMSCDRIMVIDLGKIIQFDKPNVLLQDAEGKFYEMVNKKNEMQEI